jgi:SAM-dependent methyltransferase
VLQLDLPPRGSLAPNSDVDPLKYYYAPLVGRLFTGRLNVGLRLLGGRYRRVLEIGYGSGVLLPTLARAAERVDGLDLESDADSVRAQLGRLGVSVGELVRGDVGALPFPSATYDAVIAFSIYEHLKPHELEGALAEAHRVLTADGVLLVGCPAVHKAMTMAFVAIGFRNIGEHHFSSIDDVLEASRGLFTVERTATLPRGVPLGWAPYGAVLLRRRSA